MISRFFVRSGTLLALACLTITAAACSDPGANAGGAGGATARTGGAGTEPVPFTEGSSFGGVSRPGVSSVNPGMGPTGGGFGAGAGGTGIGGGFGTGGGVR